MLVINTSLMKINKIVQEYNNSMLKKSHNRLLHFSWNEKKSVQFLCKLEKPFSFNQFMHINVHWSDLEDKPMTVSVMLLNRGQPQEVHFFWTWVSQ